MNIYNERSIWQTDKWKEFQESIGFDAFFIENGNERVLIISKKLPFKKCFFDIPRANISEALWLKILEEARRRKAIFIRMAPNAKEIPEFLREKAIFTGLHRFPELTSVLDLSLSEDELLAKMSQQGRRHLRQAQNSEVVISRSADIESFAKLLGETTKRQGFSGHDAEYYEKLLKTHGKDAFMLLAEYENRVVAGAIFVFSEHGCTYLFGASSNRVGKSNAPTLMQWEAIKIAKNFGKKWFDFLGIAPMESQNHPWQGVSQFKRKFGGKEITFAPEFEIAVSKSWFFLFRLAQGIRRLR